MSELKSRIRRIQEFIGGKREKRLDILFRCPNGEEQTGTVDDIIAAKGEFIHVRSGNSMGDFDRVLQFELDNIRTVDR